jgi:hypothetical protein
MMKGLLYGTLIECKHLGRKQFIIHVINCTSALSLTESTTGEMQHTSSYWPKSMP